MDFDPNISEIDKRLLIAAKDGNMSLCKELIASGANPYVFSDVGDIYNKNVLMCAAWSGNLDLVKYIHEDCYVNVNSEDYLEWSGTAIIYAARSGNLEMVKYLLQEGANIDSTNIESESPVFMAAMWGHFEMLKFLVESGADITQTCSFFENLLHAACKNDLRMLRYLIEELGFTFDVCYCASDFLNDCILFGSKESVGYILEKFPNELSEAEKRRANEYLQADNPKEDKKWLS